MPIVLQTLTPSFTPPPAVAAWPVSDTTNSKTKVVAYPLAPAAGVPAISTFQLNRALTGAALAKLLTLPTNPLALVAPTTQTGFSAYRQCPALGLGRNLVTNGGFLSGSHGWTLVAGSTVVADATSPTGYAVRIVSTGAYPQNIQVFPVEGGKAYSFAFQHRADGTAIAEADAQWLDASGAIISTVVPYGGTSPSVWTEAVLANQVAPGNARSVRVSATTSSASGIVFITAMRVMQQTTAPAAWTAAHQQYITRGLAIYEASTNLAADGDMEAAGVASYTAVTATLTKDTVTFFAGAKALKIVTTAIDGRAQQSIALAAGQPVTASARCKGGDATTRLLIYSQPSNTLLATMNNPNTTDWNALRVSGTVVGGDTSVTAMLVGGGNAVTSYWDNFAVENKAYDTMNADPSGQAFALAGRVLTAATIPVPAAMVLPDCAVVGVFRFDHATIANYRYLAIFSVDGTNYLLFYMDATSKIVIDRTRAGVNRTVATAAIAWNAGDTIAWAYRKNAAGAAIWYSVNGAAPVRTDFAAAADLLDLVGATPANMSIGCNPGDSRALDGTYGAFRFLKGGLSDATISALVADPYQAPTDNDLAVWGFEGATYQVPVFDDRLVKLGTAYDYAVDSTSAAPNAATAFGQRTKATTAALANSWWLRSQQDALKDIQLAVLKEHRYKVRRGAQVVDPAAGGLPSVIYTGDTAGIVGDLDILASYTTAAAQDAAEAALRALLGTQDTIWLLSPFGGLYKVKFTDGHEYARHEMFLDAKIPVLEVS